MALTEAEELVLARLFRKFGRRWSRYRIVEGSVFGFSAHPTPGLEASSGERDDEEDLVPPLTVAYLGSVEELLRYHDLKLRSEIEESEVPEPLCVFCHSRLTPEGCGRSPACPGDDLYS